MKKNIVSPFVLDRKFFVLFLLIFTVFLNAHLASAVNTVVLKQGSKGTQVIEIQKFLSDQNYNLGSIDGIFGQKTKQAVINFQATHNLTPDGIIGPKTIVLITPTTTVTTPVVAPVAKTSTTSSGSVAPTTTKSTGGSTATTTTETTAPSIPAVATNVVTSDSVASPSFTPWHCGLDIVDSRDSQTYGTVQIGDQCWTSKNMAYLPSVSPSSVSNFTTPVYYVYDYQGTDTTEAKTQTNFTTYGVLYNYPAAMTACPAGSHLPSHEEFTTLERAVCTSSTCATDFPYDYTTMGWFGTNEGTNLSAGGSSGFNGILGGARFQDDGAFRYIGAYDKLWASDVYADGMNNKAWYRIFIKGQAFRQKHPMSNGNSVRCVVE